MPQNTEPVSNYIDPNWYEEVRQFQSGNLTGPVQPAKYITPISSRTISENPVNQQELNTIQSREAAVNISNLELQKALNDYPNIIKNRALQAQIREQYSNKQMLNSAFPQEYSYTTDIKKLKDRLVLILYSPDANSNPGFNRSNRDQKLFFDTLDLLKEKFQATSEVVGPAKDIIKNNIPFGNAIFGTIEEAADSTKKFINEKLLTSQAVGEAKGKFEYLNQKFYTEGSKGDKYKIIYLPLPQGQLVDSHSHSIQGVAMNPLIPIIGAGLGIANSILGGGQKGDNRDGGRGFQANAAVGSYALNALQLTARKAINPAQETLYQSPVPRQWQFTFTYVPTNKTEAENFFNIVEMLKQHSYPTLDADAVLYNFPGTVHFYFVTNGTEISEGDSNPNDPNINTKLPRSLYPCFIKSVQINYINEGGIFTHFWDGNPTSINLTLDIVESKLLSRESLDSQLNGIKTSSSTLDKQSIKEQTFNTPPTAIA
jgi:hypothetical protein